MPWTEVTLMNQRKQFIEEYKAKIFPVTQLCKKYEISRKTAHKWIKRYHKCGEEGLINLSKAPHHPRKRIHEELVNEVLKVKDRYPTWGPRKIYAKLKESNGDLILPSKSSIGNILQHYGLVCKRGRSKKVPPTDPLGSCLSSNEIWSFDFKGWFLTGNGQKCEPFTVSDAYSRYLLHCGHIEVKTSENVWKLFEKLFWTYGLPKRVRSDNGPPFATVGAGRLSSLSILLIKAGVKPEWITPGKPQENGRHERLHRTLKRETAMPPASSLEEQHKRFLKFKRYYNYERPHDALNLKTPGSIYTPSTWNGKLRSPEYNDDWVKRKVMKSGSIKWGGEEFFIHRALYQEYVGIKKMDDDLLEIYYGPIFLGSIYRNCFRKGKRIK
jgi:transposase InsO family protein